MKSIFRSFPVALKMIFMDPVNLVLSIFPTLIALGLYFFTLVYTYRNSDRLASWFRGYIYTADQATWLAKILTAILIIFIFFLMSWTFVIVVGVIAAPFNSLLSSRIETKLVQKVYMDEDQSKAMAQVKSGMLQTFKNEGKKLFFILVVGAAAFLLNLFPLFYPVGIFLFATLVAVQFVDYSWSRHDLNFGECLKDVIKNILPYSLGGFFFLLMVAIPIVNAFVPAFATSYFTVLWLHRQKKISLFP
jgi:CysZ protein